MEWREGWKSYIECYGYGFLDVSVRAKCVCPDIVHIYEHISIIRLDKRRAADWVGGLWVLGQMRGRAFWVRCSSVSARVYYKRQKGEIMLARCNMQPRMIAAWVRVTECVSV